ncbi:MAG: hypothetical protein RL701_6410 [Pseudomonadota bacterium]
MKRFVGILCACAFAWLMAGGQASAQTKTKRAPKVIQLEEIKIEGRVQKPNAFYILNRSNLGYEVLDLRTSFVREVVRSVQADPF